MPNWFWYGLITLLSIAVFIYGLLTIKDKKIIALYTFLSGLTYLFEYVIMVLFKSYEYHPQVLKDEYFDSVLGAVVSDAFSVPMIGALIGAFQLRMKWIFFILGAFLIVEEGFLYLGVYEHFWWKTFYTVIGLLLCFIISKVWYKKMQRNLSTFVRFTTLYFTSVVLHASLAFVLVAFFKLYHYEIGWFENGTRDHVAFATVYILLYALILSLLITFHVRWVWKTIVVCLTLPINWFLLKDDILHLSNKWSLGHFLFLRFSILVLLEVFNYYFLYSKRKKNSPCLMVK